MVRLSLLLLIILGSDSANGSLSDKDLEALTLNIYWEARNQPVLGQVAVAYVTKKRVECNRFPDSYHDVVYQRTGKKQTAAFSWTPGKTDVIPADKAAYARAKGVAKLVSGGWVEDPTYGSVFYKAGYSKAKWGDKTEVVKISTHIFYVKEGVCDNEYPKDG